MCRQVLDAFGGNFLAADIPGDTPVAGKFALFIKYRFATHGEIIKAALKVGESELELPEGRPYCQRFSELFPFFLRSGNTRVVPQMGANGAFDCSLIGLTDNSPVITGKTQFSVKFPEKIRGQVNQAA